LFKKYSLIDLIKVQKNDDTTAFLNSKILNQYSKDSYRLIHFIIVMNKHGPFA